MTEIDLNTSNNLVCWRQRNAKAEAGHLEVPSDVATRCEAACTVYLERLREAYNQTDRLVNVEAFGEFPSGQQVGAKFARSAQGTPTSLDAVLLQHIDVVESMRAFFRRYFVDLESQDQRTTSNIAFLGPGN